jgi:hypothetical protein
MSTAEWQCDRSIYSNPPAINDSAPPSDDQSRPWKNHRVPSGSTVGQVLSQFGKGARQQFLNDVQAKASEAGFTPGSLAVYHGIKQSTPVRTKLGVLSKQPSTRLSARLVKDHFLPISSKKLDLVHRQGTDQPRKAISNSRSNGKHSAGLVRGNSGMGKGWWRWMMGRGDIIGSIRYTESLLRKLSMSTKRKMRMGSG